MPDLPHTTPVAVPNDPPPVHRPARIDAWDLLFDSIPCNGAWHRIIVPEFDTATKADRRRIAKCVWDAFHKRAWARHESVDVTRRTIGDNPGIWAKRSPRPQTRQRGAA